MTRAQVVVAVLGAAQLVPAAAPAAAVARAGCTGTEGITVVVDHGALGGGIRQICHLSEGADAAAVLTGTGLDLTFVQQQPGFICRVDGVPADDPCVLTPPADAYWGLWWADGEAPTWRYATRAARGLSVPAGGAVALAWQDTAERVPPDVSAPVVGDPPVGESTPSTPQSPDTGSNGPEPGDGGLPVWVAPAAIAGLFGVAGVVALLRRRSAA